jgi:hypothetical protein
MVKGRDSAIGEFDIDFIIEPYPSFGEKTGVSTSSSVKQNTVKFKRLK